MNTDWMNAFEGGLNYKEYRTLLDQLLEEGKTTGPDQSDAMIEYARLNQKRLIRGEKTVKLSEETKAELRGLAPREKWMVITEGWCGDAAQILPVLHAIESAIPGIEMRMILRDEHPEIMDQFLTNGTRGIPKLVRIDAETGALLGDWGPRPQAMQEIVNEWKKTPEVPKAEMYAKLHGFYAKDRGVEVVKEIHNLLNQSVSTVL